MSTNPLSEDVKAQIKQVQQRGWLVLTPAVLAYIVFVLVRTAGGTLASGLIDELGITPAQVAMFTSIFTYVYAFANLPAGVVTDILGARWMMSVSYLFIAVGCMLLAFSDNFSILLLGRALMGLGGSAVYTGLCKTAVGWKRARDYAGFTGQAMALSKIGTLLAATPLVLAVKTIGRKDSMLYIAIAVIAITIALFLLIRDNPESIGMKSIDELEGNEKRIIKAQNPLKGVGRLLVQPQVWLVVFASVTFNAAINTVVTNWGQTMLKQGAGFAPTAASNIIMINTICGIITGFLLAFVLKKLTLKQVTYISFGFFAIALSMISFFFTKLGTTGFSIAYALMGLGASFEISSLFAIARNMVTSKNNGTVVGLLNFIAWLLGASVSTTIWGKIIDASYSAASFQKAVLIQLIVLAVGFVCFLFIKDKTIPALADEE
ncbi:MAG: nitrate/nitrite transporter [Anaerofustis sp.]